MSQSRLNENEIQFNLLRNRLFSSSTVPTGATAAGGHDAVTGGESQPLPDKAVEEDLRTWMGAILSGKVPDRPLPECDRSALHGFLHYHGIAPSVHQRVSELNRHPRLDVLRYEPAALKQMVAREMLRMHEFLQILPEIQRSVAAPPIFFKGQAVAHTLYQETWHRPRADIDVLVDEADVPRFIEAMGRAGYQRGTVIDGDLISRQTIVHKATHQLDHIWDVHWRLSNRPGLADALPHQELAQDACFVSLYGTRFLVPGPVDNLLIACLHLVGHHSQEPRLSWLYDMFLLTVSMTSEARKRFLRKAGRSVPLESACAEGLRMAQRYFPNPIQAGLVEALMISDTIRTSGQRYYAERLTEDMRALGLKDKLRFIRQHAFPSAEYMTRRFAITRRWQLPFCYVYRISRALPKLFWQR